MKRTLSFILALLMCVSLLPLAALADGEPADAPAEAAEELEEAPATEPEAEPAAEPEPEPAAAEAAPAAVTAPAEIEAVSAPAQTTAETYSIRYIKNDGYDSSFLRREHAAGDTVLLNEVSFSRDPSFASDGTYATRYILVGWNTSKDGTGTGYALTDTLEMPAENLYLYAMWEPAEQYYWALTVEGPGTVTYQPLVGTPNSDAWLDAREGDTVKIYVTAQRKVRVGTIHGFTPTADEGYIFDGWYLYETTEENKLNVTKLTSQDLKDLVLSNEILEAGRNRIVARFIENDGTYASVKFQRDSGDGTVVYFQQMLKIGSPMPAVDDPVWANHYFLGWDQEVPDTVPETGVTLTAQWLEGPTESNTAEELYIVRCETGGHPDVTQGLYWGTSNNDIRLDAERGVYVCTVSLDRIGTYLGVGPGSYDVISGQEHFASVAWPDSPVVSLVWNGDAGQWQPDGEQIVYVYHETGDEEISGDVLAKMSPIICVTETGNADNYKELKLIEGTYEIVDIPTGSDDFLAAAVVVTDFDAYARQLGNNYVPDWDSNLHGEDYYVFYLTRELETRTTANGSPYLAWTDWRYDKEDTEFWTLGDGVLHNESSSGKELLVTRPAFTLTFTDALGVLPDQVFEVPAGDPYPAYDWTAEGVDPAIAEAVQNEEPVQIDGVWYTFIGWENYPLSLFGSVPTVSGDETFTAIWESAEAYTISFTDGIYDGEAFEPAEFAVTGSGAAFPWAEYESLEEFENELFPGLYDMQLEDGSIFLGWDPDLYEYAAEHDAVTESVAFEAIWAKPVLVAYRDGADGELFEDVYVDFLMGFDDFPEFQMEDDEGSYLTEPVREGYTFVDWVSFVDEEASYTFEDEDTGFTVNAYVNEDEGYTDFVIYLDAQWEPEFIDLKITHSTSLGNNLSIVYYIPTSYLEGYDNVRLHAEKNKYNADGSDCTVSEFDLMEYTVETNASGVERYRFVFRDIAAKEMGDDVRVTVLADKDGVTYSSAVDTYSVKTYAMNQLRKTSDASLKTLMVDLLNYGAQAQAYFGYNTAHPANEYLTADQQALGTQTLGELTSCESTTETPGATARFSSKSVVLGNEIVIKYYMKFDEGQSLDNVRAEFTYTTTAGTPTTVPFDASEFDYDSENDRYAVRLQTIAAKDAGQPVTARIYDGDTLISEVLTYSIESYAYNQLNNDDLGENARAIITAMMKFCKSAESYFTN